jgi:hypothetical protein
MNLRSSSFIPQLGPISPKKLYGWSPGMVVGASLALFGVGMAIVQGALICPALRRFGERAARSSMASPLTSSLRGTDADHLRIPLKSHPAHVPRRGGHTGTVRPDVTARGLQINKANFRASFHRPNPWRHLSPLVMTQIFYAHDRHWPYFLLLLR